MKTIAVLGTGKTGGEVLTLLGQTPGIEVIALNRRHPPTAAVWERIDAAVCFLPGPALLEHLDLFMADPKPMIIGSTGYELSPDQIAHIQKFPCPWVMSSNFSLGMALAKSVITQMASWADQSGLRIQQSIEETHHVHKKDAPSGTALLWKNWALAASSVRPPPAIAIESHRVEDECGRHEYTLTLARETMTFKHDATSRAVFAEGAVWALHQILRPDLKLRGQIDFFELIASAMSANMASTITSAKKEGPP